MSSTSGEEKKYSNRLGLEKSPYLLQHASNPVDWYFIYSLHTNIYIYTDTLLIVMFDINYIVCKFCC